MSGTVRAEQAVTEARDRLHRSLLLVAAGDEQLPEALDASLDNLIRAVEARCAARALGELLTDQTGDPTDEAYNRGVRDAARAIQEQS